MPEKTYKIIFSRHARRRMKLYHITDEDVMTILEEGDKEYQSPYRLVYMKNMPGYKYPIKIIV